MNEYLQDNHDHINWPQERLEARVADIQHRMGIIAYSGERLAQSERELDIIAFELACRYRDRKLGEIAMAWEGREETLKRIEHGTLET
jgi:hypothetical protein